MSDEQVKIKKLRDSALRRLSRRECSCANMISWLEKRGAESSEAETVVEALAREGWIDDRRYARAVVRELLQKGKGLRALKLGLRTRGLKIPESYLNELLSELDVEGELVRAQEVVRRRYPGVCGDKRIAARAYRGLLSRGFTEGVARQAVFTFKDKDNEA